MENSLRDKFGYFVVESELQAARKCANFVMIQMEVRDQGSPPLIRTKRPNMTTKPSSALLSTIRNPSKHNP